MIENCNNFQFSQAVCVRNRQVNLPCFETAGNITPSYSPFKISCCDVIHVISSFLWDKDNHTISFLCLQNGWAGGYC